MFSDDSDYIHYVRSTRARISKNSFQKNDKTNQNSQKSIDFVICNFFFGLICCLS